MHRYLKLAIEQAYNHNYEENMDYNHCAVIAKGGNVISIGFNKNTTNSFVEYYTSKVRGANRDYCLSTHAEQDAILSVRSKIDLSGCKIFVARIRPPQSPNGKIGLSRPCEICERTLVAYGINKAFYTIDDYSYGILNIKKMRDEKIKI